METTPLMFGELDMKPVEPVEAGGSVSSYTKVKIKETQLIFSSIIDEIQTNLIDSITILCYDGIRVTTSCFLLASISPYMATLLRYADTMDYLIVLPDVESEAVTRLINIALGRIHLLSQEDKEALKQFDGLFWDNGFKQHEIVVPHQKLNPPKHTVKHEATEFSSFNVAEFIKEEPIEGAEYFFPEADTKELSEFKELNSKNLVKEKILSGRYISEDQIRVDLEEHGHIDPEFNADFDEDINYDEDYKVENFEENNDEDTNETEKKFERPEKKTNRGIAGERRIESLGDTDFDLCHDDNKKRKFKKKTLIGTSVHSNNLNQDESWIEINQCLNVNRKQQIKSEDDIVDKTYSCQLCEKSFSKRQDLANHKRIHKKPNTCNVCGKTFSRKSGLDDHKFVHIGKSLECDICGKLLSNPRSLKQHKLNHKGKGYCCKFCGVRFENKDDLSIHKSTHKNDRPYSCEICGKNYTRPGHLTTHKKIHTGERPYVCDVCGKSFIYQSHLKEHNANHTGEKPFACKLCDKRYLFRNALRLHEKYHSSERTKVSCKICKKELNKDSLNKHMRIHEGIKPFSCEVCEKTFIQKGPLEIHMRIHTGEKPYSCEQCGKKFAFESNMKRHEKTHTS